MKNITILVFILTFCFMSTAQAALLDWFKGDNEEEVKSSFKVVVLGDSLTSGTQLDAKHNIAQVLETYINRKSRKAHEFINMSRDGQTTSIALSKMKRILAHEPKYVVIILGYEDAQQQITPARVEQNLLQIIQRLQANDISPIIVGARAPATNGLKYKNEFDIIFKNISTQYNLPIYQYLTKAIWGNSHYYLNDGVTPNEKGIEAIVEKLSIVVQRAFRPPIIKRGEFKFGG